MLHTSTRKLTLAGMLTAMAVALGYALAGIPNVELVTATIFLAGFLLGPGYGAAVGFSAELIYTTFNPYGMAALPVMLAQVLGMTVAGLAGAAFPVLLRGREFRTVIVLCAAAGFLLTLQFDLLTTLATALVLGFSLDAVKAMLVFGGVFYATHLLSNTLIFAFGLPIFLRSLRRHRQATTAIHQDSMEVTS